MLLAMRCAGGGFENVDVNAFQLLSKTRYCKLSRATRCHDLTATQPFTVLGGQLSNYHSTVQAHGHGLMPQSWDSWGKVGFSESDRLPPQYLILFSVLNTLQF
jgi:hypothetical protein